ncbi:Protein of unknown function [Weissella confusa LBAE C39-2]|uniref:hypothetical protein n=2 Tax=Weissella confusa TaxID=1583 RepID=UPI0002465A0F|nr:hypothetical protein [Weissella confusa]MBJ7616765.1 hypothetical protein [Weissella confusa]MBJ7698795.1 hypothetical protein [Weissella confusa]MBS7550745.1 hypothetical protein [Weissella confusa]MDY2513184.1 hypothetical protein [Weissella confusa]TGE53383.1 hypothetical protein C6P18_02450 [Weissella confusa]
MNEFTPEMISPKQLFSIFIVQGVENLFDEELAEQLGTSVASLSMMREAKFVGISVPPWLALNVHRLLSEKHHLIEATKQILEDDHGGL